jgi:metal-responsive CopG/Arc/MetJ family transcriptional regulator
MAVNPETTVRKLVSLPREMLREIEDYRFAKRIKTESETMRLLLRAGLDANKVPARKKG